MTGENPEDECSPILPEPIRKKVHMEWRKVRQPMQHIELFSFVPDHCGKIERCGPLLRREIVQDTPSSFVRRAVYLVGKDWKLLRRVVAGCRRLMERKGQSRW